MVIGKSYSMVFCRYSEELAGEVDNWNGGDGYGDNNQEDCGRRDGGEKTQTKSNIEVEIIFASSIAMYMQINYSYSDTTASWLF